MIGEKLVLFLFQLLEGACTPSPSIFKISSKASSNLSMLQLHIPSFLRAQRGEWLQSGGCYRAHTPSFLSALRAHQLKVEGCNRPCFLLCQEMCHFSTLSVQSLSCVQSLQPHESQHARSPSPSPTARVHSNSCHSSR